MARTVSISKVGGATIVDIVDTEAQNEKRVYNKDVNFYTTPGVLIIGCCSPFSELRIPFSEITDKLLAADVDAYVAEIVKPANGFFNANVVL